MTTPSNAQLLQSAVDKAAAAGHHLRIHLVPFPSKDVDLPDGFENLVNARDFDAAVQLHRGAMLLRPKMEHLLPTELRPDCIVSDAFYPWTADVAFRLGIPRLIFYATCIFAAAVEKYLTRSDSPHLAAKSDSEPFVVPGFPDPITLTRSQLPDHFRAPIEIAQTIHHLRDAELKGHRVLVNSFLELEPRYTEYYYVITGLKVYHIGPTALAIHRDVPGEDECLSWLESKRLESVVYVSFGPFGKWSQFPDQQIFEIATALEATRHHFMWVVPGNDTEEEKEQRRLPKGFEERMRREGKGIIVRGWAPQVAILGHPAVGGFVTECGWNSVVEAIGAGVAMVAWPVTDDQFYNEKMVTHVLGIGVGVGPEEWSLWEEVGKKAVIRKERIEEAVRRVMDGGDEGREMRRKAKELAEAAKRAVGEGGSSYRNLTALIDDLKQREQERSAATAKMAEMKL